MRIAVLLSGGVDSSVAALLLKEQGYKVTGITMLNYADSTVANAKEAAQSLGIEHIVIDVRKLFADKVINYFCSAYEEGKTPNPCIECNEWIKFGALYAIANDAGFDKIATGHYAQIEYDKISDRYLLKKGVDITKDQSYFLYRLKQDQLCQTVFPLGEMQKEDVKEIAKKSNIKGTEGESQEVCFISGDYREFISDSIVFTPGEIVDLKGNLLGTHRGLPFYTIGQRKGLGISVGRPVYVIELDLQKNRLVVDDEKYLYRDHLVSTHNNFIIADFNSPAKVQTKIRYKASLANAVIEHDDDNVQVEFDEPQRAITSGQSIVFYQGDYVLGGGLIE